MNTVKSLKGKKICITYYTFPHLGGISSIIDDLWEYLNTKYPAHIFVYKSDGDITKYGKSIHVCRSNAKAGPFIFPFIWFYILFMTYNLWKLHRKYNFNLILPQDGFCSGLFSLLVGRLTRARVIIMDHGTLTNILDPSWEEMMSKATSSRRWKRVVRQILFPLSKINYRLIIKLVTRYGEEFLFCGKELEDYYVRGKVPSRKLKRYFHLVNTDFFKPLSRKEREEERKRWGISPNLTLINVVSRLDEEKGFEYILPSLEKVKASGEVDFLVLIAGEGRRRKEIVNYLEAHQMGDQVKLLGSQSREKVKRLMQISDLHLYAGTVGCSASIALLEAMACGCASIVTTAPEMHREVVKPEIGWVIPPRDIDALTYSLMEALRNKEILIKMGENSRRYIEDTHSFKSAGKYFEFFEP